VCSKGQQRSSVHRPGPCQPSFCGQVLACTESATLKYWTRSQYLSALLGAARDSQVYPRRPQMEKMCSAHITPIRPLPGDSAHISAIKIAASRGGDEKHSGGGGRLVPGLPIQKQDKTKNPRERLLRDPIGRRLWFWFWLVKPPHR